MLNQHFIGNLSNKICKMLRNYVLSPLKENFCKKSNNLICGKWNYENKFQKKYVIKKNKHHWDNIQKRRKDYNHLEKFYSDKIKEFSKLLNSYHKTKKSMRYWEIVLGPFLVRSIMILWDKWEIINSDLKKEKIDKITCRDTSYKSFIFNDTEEFYLNYCNYYFNEFLCFEIVKYLKKNIYLNIIKKKPKISFKNKKSFVNKITSFNFNNKSILYRTFFGKVNSAKINLKLGNIPYFKNFDYRITKFKIDHKFRNYKIRKSKIINFENFFFEIILKILPASILENFSELRENSKKIFNNPKIIFTANANIGNDFFKIWAAEKTDNGSKYIIGDHGGVMEDKMLLNYTHNVSDIYVRSCKSNKSNTLQMPPNFILTTKKIVKKNQMKCLIPLMKRDFFTGNIFEPKLTEEEQIMKIKEFIKLIRPEIKNNIQIKPHPYSDNIFKSKVSSMFKRKVYTSNQSFKESLKNFKLVLNTEPSTVFFESFYYDIPNVLIFNRDFLHLNKKVEKLITKMKSNNLIFDNPRKAINHLNKIWLDPFIWWNSNKILKIRKEFQDLCALNNGDNENDWLKFFKKQIMN